MCELGASGDSYGSWGIQETHEEEASETLISVEEERIKGRKFHFFSRRNLLTRKSTVLSKTVLFLSLCRLFRERKRQDLRTSGNLGLLGQGAESFGGELELHATDTLRLDIDRKRAASLHIRVTPIVSGFGAASGQVAYSTHRRKISCLVTDMRVSWIGGNGKCPCVLRVFTFFRSKYATRIHSYRFLFPHSPVFRHRS